MAGAPIPIHGRDHCPGGPDPIPCLAGLPALRATRRTTLTVPSGSETEILWTDWTNSDTSIFSETLSGGDLRKVAFLLAGVYSINVGHIWATPYFYEAHSILILDDSTAGSQWFDVTSMGSHQVQTSDAFVYPQTFGVTRAYPVEPTATGYSAGQGGMGRLLFKANQHSGSNKTLDAAWVDVFYHGATA